jgi:flagellar protein FlgJ
MQAPIPQVYTDFSALSAMRARAREDQQGTLDQVSRQFEALFLQMMLKGMRSAGLGDGGLMDSRQSDFYREMYDKQIAIDMAQTRGIGLADVIKRQLGGADAAGQGGRGVQDYAATPITARPALAGQAPAAAAGSAAVASASLDGTPAAFVRTLWPAAEKAGARLGLAPEALLAQAALETGWGRHVMRGGEGASSHNLFGIKADRRWSGDTVSSETTEYRDGVALRTRDQFRAYASFEQSFEDYVDFVQRNPRYREALRQTADPRAYFEALQAAGYATDPVYADKIGRILDSDTLRNARQQAVEDATAT